MRIYLDMCCYSRLFDEDSAEKFSVDAKKIIQIQREIVQKNFDLVTSFMLHYENYRKKDEDQRDKIDFFIKSNRKIYVGIDSVESLKIFADDFVSQGLKLKDAYHLASAIFANCDYFLTFDKKLLKFTTDRIKILNPVEFMEVYENGNIDGR